MAREHAMALGRAALFAARRRGAPQAACVQSAGFATAEPAKEPLKPSTPNHIIVTVNDKQVEVMKGSTVMAACEAAGIDIPRFCYHQRLSIAGNCRMCLVEVAKAPKPVASCAMPAAPNMVVKTETPLVRKAREGVMEFMLINHPLDCPICDQGGECDLQDQSFQFGSDRGRFTEMKRSVKDKNLGPLVKTVMTRCIHCTRCVRFATEIAGVQDLGMTGRGNASEIGTYVEKMLQSELSGNVIDLCPVGALTSKPFAFTARNWELKSTESVDVSDGLGANIRVDSRGAEVMRIVPVQNDAVNEEWISDKARFQYDGLKRQRLNVPLVRSDGALRPAQWREALAAAAEALKSVKGSELRFIAGRLADLESMAALKDLAKWLGSGATQVDSGYRDLANRLGSGATQVDSGCPELDADVRSTYVANTTVSGIEAADAILLIGTNPRVEAPVFNARIRKTWLEGTPVASIGEAADLSYPVEHLGEGAAALAGLLKGGPVLERLQAAERPAIIVGPGMLARPDRAAVLQQVHELVEKAGVVKEGWNGYNVLHDMASRVGALDIGFLPSARASAPGAPPPKVVYLLGSDDYADADVPAGAFVIYQGHHGDRGAARADVVLPSAAYTEKTATFVNFEGRPQRTRAAVPRVGDARPDWQVVRALSEVVGAPLPYDSDEGVRARLAELAPHLGRVAATERPLWLNGEYFKAFADRAGKKAAADKAPFASSVANFYQTDVISRTSVVMAKCVQAKASMRHGSLYGGVASL